MGLLLVTTSPMATVALVSVLRGRLEHEVNIGPVEAQLGRMRAVHVHVTIRNDLFNEARNFVNHYLLDRFNLVHN